MIKFLIAKKESGKAACLSLDEIFDYIFFISQCNILKYHDGFLYLEDLNFNDENSLISNFLNPPQRSTKADRAEEFREMTSLPEQITFPTLELFNPLPSNMEFIEGNKKIISHFKVEWSGLLRKYYKQHNPDSVCCACGLNTSKRYPWVDYMLDIHHLLPLSSNVAISSRGTSLTDIVGLCPSCHRAVHMYYKKWLKENNQEDFKSKEEARKVYEQSIKEIVLP